MQHQQWLAALVLGSNSRWEQLWVVLAGLWQVRGMTGWCGSGCFAGKMTPQPGPTSIVGSVGSACLPVLFCWPVLCEHMCSQGLSLLATACEDGCCGVGVSLLVPSWLLLLVLAGWWSGRILLECALYLVAKSLRIAVMALPPPPSPSTHTHCLRSAVQSFERQQRHQCCK